MLTSDHLIAELPLQPVISKHDERVFYACNYCNLPIYGSAAAFPEAVLRGREPKDPTTRLRGRFISYNAMLAWLAERRQRLPQDLYTFVRGWVDKRARDVNPQYNGKAALVRAPPAHWLVAQEDGAAPLCTEQQWVDAHKGPIFFGGDIDPAVELEMRSAHLRDRQKKADARKSAPASLAGLADAADLDDAPPQTPPPPPHETSAASKAPEQPAPTDTPRSTASSLSSRMSSQALDQVLAELIARGYVKDSRVDPPAAAAPAASSAAAVAKAAAPKKRANKSDAEKEAKKKEKKEKIAAAKAKLTAAKQIEAAADAAVAEAAKVVAKASAPRKRSVDSDQAEAVKVPAGKRAAAEPEVGSKLPKGTRTMVFKLGQKLSGEVEADFYKSLTRAFVGSAKQFRGPEFAALLTCHKGTLRLQSLTGAAAVVVPEMEMADAEL